jgi:beta-lactamase class A
VKSDKEENMHRDFATATGLVLVLALILSLAGPLTAAPDGGRLDELRKHIEAACADTDGRVGLAAKHLETGEELLVNGDEPFPMASTFKLPVLVEVLAQAAEGRFSLDDEVSIRPEDQHLGSGLLADLTAPGVRLSVRNVAMLMMLISDNSAADILLAKVGADNVNQRLRRFGIEGLTVNRSCQELILDTLGLDFEKYGRLSPAEIGAAVAKAERDKPGYLDEVRRNFSRDDKDRTTPRAMNALLEKIQKKEILDPASCDLVLDIMFKCQTGQGRIKGLLPPGTAVAHKTGTIGGTANDVGLIVLPDGLGHVALSILAKDFTRDTSEVEKIISQCARYVYDYFTFTR